MKTLTKQEMKTLLMESKHLIWEGLGEGRVLNLARDVVDGAPGARDYFNYLVKLHEADSPSHFAE